MTDQCTMGVGCNEYGVCYAEAHGQPEQCPLYVARSEQPDLSPELLKRVAALFKQHHRGTCYPDATDFEAEEFALAIAPMLIAHGRKLEKAEVAKRFDHIRSDLNNISRAIEDEGDRCYFGSTNDPDELRRVACDFEDWLLREERNEHKSKP